MVHFKNEMDKRCAVILMTCTQCELFSKCTDDSCPEWMDNYVKIEIREDVTDLLAEHSFDSKREGCNWEQEYISFYCQLARKLGAHGLVDFDRLDP
jgi:hypothetical protein